VALRPNGKNTDHQEIVGSSPGPDEVVGTLSLYGTIRRLVPGVKKREGENI